MKNQQKIDKILISVKAKIEDEVGALIGVDFKLTDFFNQIVTKEDYFSELTGKKIVAKLDITGEIEGHGGLVVDVKDAIRLGGTLIMLPPAELDEVVRNESYTDETEDSYGEIANIIAGSYTKVFEEMYPKNCRFIRKEQDLISPIKIDIDSDEPILDQWYYLARTSMIMDDLQMGEIDVLIPAEQFEIEVPQVVKETEEEITPKQTQENEVISEPVAPQVTEQQEPEKIDTTPAVDVKKQQKLVDKLLKKCQEKIAEEVGALLGVDIKLSPLGNKTVTKEEYFLEEAVGKQVLAHMDVVDEAEDKSFLFVSAKDAIRIGSILIMLPPSELEDSVNEEDFSADAEDAYGEIANIISGVYTAVFKDQYPQSFRFIKKDIELVAPMKVDIDSDDVIDNQSYYMSSSNLEIDGKKFSNMAMLFPLPLLKLEQLSEDISIAEKNAINEVGGSQQVQTSGDIAGGSFESTEKVVAQDGTADDIDILLIEDNREEAEKIKKELTSSGIVSKTITFGDNINYHISPSLKLIFIIMREVNEQAYGITIKVNSLSGVPIVAAGPEWTRTKVIKAVKYGVNDILLTPAGESDIKEKVEENILQLAA